MPVKASDYPPSWPDTARKVKDSSDWCCQFCGAPHGMPPFVLTVHHIDHNPMNSDPSNLIALCQCCHLKCQRMEPYPHGIADLLYRLDHLPTQLALL